jgi:hypothetical protein
MAISDVPNNKDTQRDRFILFEQCKNGTKKEEIVTKIWKKTQKYEGKK